MRPGSPAGHASTWIAAQAPGPLSGGPFIQVGVTEDEGVARAARRRADVYTAFWSATTLRFHPAPLFPVGAGDRLQASLTLSGSRWRVTIADLTTGRRASFSTAAEARGSFNLAEWLQEDPTDERGAPEPYPRLGLVRFDRLAVDGRPPLYRGLDAQWMSVDGEDLAPTPLRGGGFALQATSLTRAGARYLAAVAPEDRVQSVFDGELSQWTPATPPGRIEAESGSLATALQQYARALRSGTWPLAARRPIAALASRAGTLTALVRTVPRAAGAARRAWAARYGAEAAAMAHRAHEVRRALHLPEAGAASVLAPVG